MTTHPTLKELNEVIAPFKNKHLTPGDDASLQEWKSGHSDILTTGKGLMEEATALMVSGGANSAAAMDFARRLLALTNKLRSIPLPVTVLKPKLKAMMDDARSDPEASRKLEVFGFIEKAVADLKAQDSDADAKG